MSFRNPITEKDEAWEWPLVRRRAPAKLSGVKGNEDCKQNPHEVTVDAVNNQWASESA